MEINFLIRKFYFHKIRDKLKDIKNLYFNILYFFLLILKFIYIFIIFYIISYHIKISEFLLEGNFLHSFIICDFVFTIEVKFNNFDIILIN